MKKTDSKVVLIRLTTKFGCVRREFASLSRALSDSEDRAGSIEKDTFAWSILSPDEKTCVAWGSIPTLEALDHHGHVDFIVQRNAQRENSKS